jgi:hypothetical protein
MDQLQKDGKNMRAKRSERSTPGRRLSDGVRRHLVTLSVKELVAESRKSSADCRPTLSVPEHRNRWGTRQNSHEFCYVKILHADAAPAALAGWFGSAL